MSRATIAAFFIAALVLFTLFPVASRGQLVVNNTVNATDGVQNVLLGTGVVASGITFQGTNDQIGSFTCNGCGLNIGSGLVIGTGNVSGAVGPNNSGSYSLGPPSGTDSVGDDDLEDLSGMALNNTAVLEFDFVVTGDSLAFNYVFSSEEYPEFVNSVNDAFGFFLSGPGITGPYTNNAANIALIPGTSVPISINTVNGGENSQYYNSNGSANIQADGYTTVLTAFADVICGETYHIKIAVGDALDGSWDSWVYLEAGSFQSNQLTMEYIAPNLSSPLDGGMYEGCEPANIVLTRAGGLDTEQVYDLAFSGTATEGADINVGLNQVIFPVGVSSVTLPMVAFQDGILEGQETLTVTLISGSCGSDFSLDVIVYDLPELTVTGADVTINCGELAEITPVISGGLGNYELTWSDGSTGPTHSSYPSDPESYAFTVTDTCGVPEFNGLANVFFVVNPPIVADIGGDLVLNCLDQVDIFPVVSGGFGAYSYSWLVNGSEVSTAPDFTINGNVDATIELVVSDDCDDTGSDVMNVTYPPVPVIVDLGSDLSVTCLDENVLTPDVSGGIGTYSFEWTDESGAYLGSSISYSLQVSEDHVITLTISDECGNEGSDDVNVIVPAVPVIVDLGNDVIVYCLDMTDFVPDVSGGIGSYNYNWSDLDGSLGNVSELSYQANSDNVLTLQVTDQCGNSGEDFANVIVPAVPIDVDLGSDLTVTCLDVSDIIPEVSGGVGAYSYQWSDQDGLIGSSDLLSYQTYSSTTIALNVSDECGNSGSDFIDIGVPQVVVTLDLGDDLTVQCIDEVSISGEAFGGVGNFSYSWTVNGGPAGNQSALNTTFPANSVVSLEIEDQCGNGASDAIEITIPPVPLTADAGADQVSTCIEAALLSASGTGGVGQYSYVWSDDQGDFSQSMNAQYTAQNNTTLTLTVTDQCGNYDTDQVNIEIPSVTMFAEVTADTVICVNEGVFLEGIAMGGVGAITASWSDVESTGESIYVTPSMTSTYTFSAYDQCGNSASAEVTVRVTDVMPNFTAAYLDDFTIAFTNTTSDADYVVWEFSDGEITSEENPVHEFLTTEIWQATLTAYKDGGCRRSISQEYFPSGNLFAPNAFTPDQDGINDFFLVQGHDIISYEIVIFDRWGNTVYESDDMTKPWDGSFQSGDYYVPDGPYNYQIKALDKRGNIYDHTGYVIILR